MITKEDVIPGAAYVFDYYGAVEIAIIVSFANEDYVNVYLSFRQEFHTIGICGIVNGDRTEKNGNYGFIKNEDKVNDIL